MKIKYPKDLKDAAKHYLIELFQNPKEASESSPTVVACAMVILQGVGWFQDEKENTISAIQDMFNQGESNES